MNANQLLMKARESRILALRSLEVSPRPGRQRTNGIMFQTRRTAGGL
ncbi:hypothetical protein [Puniceibacterium confluentis]|nr:hypothetical protein [Puniceibacterium confluentis]